MRTVNRGLPYLEIYYLGVSFFFFFLFFCWPCEFTKVVLQVEWKQLLPCPLLLIILFFIFSAFSSLLYFNFVVFQHVILLWSLCTFFSFFFRPGNLNMQTFCVTALLLFFASQLCCEF